MGYLVEILRWLGLAHIGLGDRRAARETFGEMLEFSAGTSNTINPDFTSAMSGIALSASQEQFRDGARLTGALMELSRDAGMTYMWKQEKELEIRLAQPLIDALGGDEYRRAQDEGRVLAYEDAVELARALAAA